MALKRAGLTEADVAQKIQDRATARQVPSVDSLELALLGSMPRRACYQSLLPQGLFLHGGLTVNTLALLLQEKAFEEADAVRARLADVGILIMDSPAGTTWRPGVRLVDA
jgi:hypothetical protein